MRRSFYRRLTPRIAIGVCVAMSMMAPASEAGVVHPLGAIDGLPVSDLGQYAAYRLATGSAVVIRDTVRHARRQVTFSPSCYPGALWRDVTLVNCVAAGQPATPEGKIGQGWTVDASSFDRRLIYSHEDFFAEPFAAMGRYWATSAASPCAECSKSYVNWHTGALRIARGRRDLSRSTLPRTQVSPPRYPRIVQVSYAAGSRLSLRLSPGRTITLSRCRSGCKKAVIAAGLVTWTEFKGTGIFAYRISDRTHLKWTLPAAASERGVLAIPATGEVLALAFSTEATRLYWMAR